MANVQMSRYLQRKFLDALLIGDTWSLATPVYMAALTAFDTAGETTYTEVTSANGYDRLKLTFGTDAAGRSIAITADAIWDAATGAGWQAGAVYYLGFFDAATRNTGNLLFWVAMPVPVTVGVGTVLGIASGNLAFSMGGCLTDDYANKWLCHVFRNDVGDCKWATITDVEVGLIDDYTDDATYTEKADSGYVRGAVHDGATHNMDAATDASPAASVNNADIGIGTAGANWAASERIGFWDTTGANDDLILSKASVYTVLQGTTFVWLAGDLVVTAN
jgi:hypothetical protein